MDKKILILGGTQISLQILEAAKELGLEVYVLDYNSDSPCKCKADKSFDIDATDITSVVSIIKDNKIDGVITGYADVLLPYYIEICKDSGLPCYANEKSIGVSVRKDELKKYCKEFGIPVVEEYRKKDVLNGHAQFPIILKPVDNSGARGIYICRNIKEFNENINKALSFSKSKIILIERFMEDKEEATIFYYLHSGTPYLLGIGDRWMLKQSNDILPLPIGYTFPSRYINNFLSEEDIKFKRMFKALGMKEGVVFIQSFVERGKYHVYEFGYRLTGSLEHHLMESQYNFNHLKSMLSFAIGDQIDASNLKTLDPTNCCMANVTLLLKEGKINKYCGLDNLNEIPGFINYHISYPTGKVIDKGDIGRLSQVGLRVLIKASDYPSLLAKMDKVKDTVSVRNQFGEEMLIKNYSYKDLCQ